MTCFCFFVVVCLSRIGSIISGYDDDACCRRCVIIFSAFFYITTVLYHCTCGCIEGNLLPPPMQAVPQYTKGYCWDALSKHRMI